MRISSDQCLLSENNLSTRERETFPYSTFITCSTVIPRKASKMFVIIKKYIYIYEDPTGGVLINPQDA